MNFLQQLDEDSRDAYNKWREAAQPNIDSLLFSAFTAGAAFGAAQCAAQVTAAAEVSTETEQ